MTRRFCSIICIAAAAAVSMLIFTTLNVYAAQDLELERTVVDMDAEIDQHSGMVSVWAKEGCTETIISAEPAGSGVVSTEISVPGNELMLYVVNTGETTVNVTGSEGTVIPVQVKIGDAALQTAMKCWVDIGNVYYGAPKLIVDALPGAKVSIKIGKDKYKAFTMPEKDDAFTRKYVKLKRVYNIGTKITATFTKGKAKVTRTYKFSSASSTSGASASGKKFKAIVWNVHKGDTIRLTIGGKTYTRKVKKNYNEKTLSVTFKTRKKIGKNAGFKVVIKNKYKKTLDTLKEKLRNGSWDIEDEWED